jgi:hypothetical protein
MAVLYQYLVQSAYVSPIMAPKIAILNLTLNTAQD